MIMFAIVLMCIIMMIFIVIIGSIVLQSFVVKDIQVCSIFDNSQHSVSRNGTNFENAARADLTLRCICRNIYSNNSLKATILDHFFTNVL